MKKNPNARLAVLLVLAAILVSACTQTYSQAPLTTPTLLPTGLFVSPFPSGQDPLQIVAALGTQTAMAKTAEIQGTATQGTLTSLLSPTVGFGTQALSTPAPITVVPGLTSSAYGTQSNPTDTSVRPTTYTLQEGEYIYCIARRFNLNPDDLIGMNPNASQTVYAGLTLNIPQSGAFPGDRSLHSHPDTYTVSGGNDTSIYGVACYYGDVFPEAIAAANNLQLSSTLTVGQQLTIP